jgi:glucoamylase
MAQNDGYWIPEENFYSSRMTEANARSAKDLDIAVILAAIHAGGDEPTHSVRDARIAATLTRLEGLFRAEYPINQGSRSAEAPAMGRYSGDLYYSGGAYYFSTLGAAEFYFRAAALMDHDEQGRAQARLNFARGDAFLTTVRAFTPASGELSEQFDQTTGAQTSAKHLAWSYAAFITCIAARRTCLAPR